MTYFSKFAALVKERRTLVVAGAVALCLVVGLIWSLGTHSAKQSVTTTTVVVHKHHPVHATTTTTLPPVTTTTVVPVTRPTTTTTVRRVTTTTRPGRRSGSSSGQTTTTTTTVVPVTRPTTTTTVKPATSSGPNPPPTSAVLSVVRDGVRSCEAANFPTIVLYFTYSNGYTWVATLQVSANDPVVGGNILYPYDPSDQSRTLPTEIAVSYDPSNSANNFCKAAPAGTW